MHEQFHADAVCCFFGHREISQTAELEAKLYAIIESLITTRGVRVFLFGSKSQFISLCHTVVTALRDKYPHIQRVYVRAEFPDIREDYEKYLLQYYEATSFPQEILHAGKAVYYERNCIMIDRSDYCVAYYDRTNQGKQRKNGTSLAYEYAQKHHKEIINLCP